ncbi:MAG TPA: transposase, partial [Fimbriimonadaceae bacterium]|nr:transposase [Fimbriimonadaceae bacterium]
QICTAYTLCEASRKPCFTNADLVDPLIGLLEESLVRHACLAPIYCFMPDHMHVLVFGQTEVSSSKAAIENFKGSSGRWFSRAGVPCRWQRGYYDRIIGESEEWRKQAAYVYQNPVRAGLVEDPSDYPFTGAIGFDLLRVLSENY